MLDYNLFKFYIGCVCRVVCVQMHQDFIGSECLQFNMNSSLFGHIKIFYQI